MSPYVLLYMWDCRTDAHSRARAFTIFLWFALSVAHARTAISVRLAIHVAPIVAAIVGREFLHERAQSLLLVLRHGKDLLQLLVRLRRAEQCQRRLGERCRQKKERRR